jgi:predicted  nucleic acid-binding Zn-ribbon protein
MFLDTLTVQEIAGMGYAAWQKERSMSDYNKMKLLAVLNNLGPNMDAEQNQVISDAIHEIDRLRAEVASLSEQYANDGGRIVDLTQQLAAANGRVEMLKAGLVKIADVYEYTNQIPEDMTIAEWMAEQADAALSNLNEDGKA